MRELLLLFSVLILTLLNKYNIYFTEELIMCISLILFFSGLIFLLRNGLKRFFFKELKNFYIIYIYIYLLNIKAMEKIAQL